jgi:sugar phosphate isomerase/epimerase
MRIVCDDANGWGRPFGERFERLVPMIQAAAERASACDIRLAIENHGDLRMTELIEIVRAVSSDNVGICFDNGNCLRVGDQPLAAARAAAPYVLMVHLKDVHREAVFSGDPSASWTTVPLGRGREDLVALLDAFAEAAAPVFVELSVLHPDYGDEDEAVAEGLRFLRLYAAGKR